MISLKAISLQQHKSHTGGRGFYFRDQARFAHTCLPAKQGHMPFAAFRLLKQQMEAGKLRSSPNQYRANDRRIEWCRHEYGSSGEAR